MTCARPWERDPELTCLVAPREWWHGLIGAVSRSSTVNALTCTFISTMGGNIRIVYITILIQNGPYSSAQSG